MRVLVVGSGGREHALCWAINGSPLLTKLWCAPGNPGIAQIAECVSIGAMDVPALVAFAQRKNIDLVVPGPEGPLVAGITDAMTAVGIPCCGPTREAAMLETSKTFAKQVCDTAGIPTASWRRFDDALAAKQYIRDQDGRPVVVKADGLAAGKGVIVPDSEDDALRAIDTLMDERAAGDAGRIVLIEERLTGEEISFFALCDGEIAIPFGVAQDHKRLGVGDVGPNTGGMGAYSPPPSFQHALESWVMRNIIFPTLKEMSNRGTPYRGILYAGLMMTADGIKLIEFNARFGDPECQALVLRMKSDLLDALSACAAVDDMTLAAYNVFVLETREADSNFRWKDQSSIVVVMAAPGYPEAPQYGSKIGLNRVTVTNDVHVFHAGTELVRGQLQVAGGRVLTVCALADDLAEAQRRVYGAISQIDWPEGYYRHDIGHRALP